MQLDYAKKPGTRWKMPAKWYRFEIGSVSSPLATVIALVTSIACETGTPQQAQRIGNGDERTQQDPTAFGFQFSDLRGRTIFGASIPNDPGLIGQVATFQAGVADPGSAVPIQFHTTNAMVLTIQP